MRIGAGARLGRLPLIKWQPHSEAQLATLKWLGTTAALAIANRDGAGTPVERQLAPILANGLKSYGENIATGYYAASSPTLKDEVVLALPWPPDVKDMRKKQGLERTDRVALALDAVSPTLLTLSR
jgi:hypothetical protein